MATRASFPPGDAREDWAILRALSDVLGQAAALRLARRAARRRCTRRIRICAHRADRAGRSGRSAQARGARRQSRQGAVPLGDRAISISPIRSRAPRRSWPSVRRWPKAARPRRRRSRADGRDSCPTTSGRSIVIVAESVLLLVILLVAVAYVLYADRKIWAAVQIRRGPNVVGPWGLLQSFADLLKFVLKEPVIPAAPTRACSCSRRWSPARWRSPPGR